MSLQGFEDWDGWFDWTGMEERKGKKLCTACGPVKFKNGDKTEFEGRWHGEFSRTFLPLGKFKTNSKGNLEHVDTGETGYKKYAIDPPQTGEGAVTRMHYPSFKSMDAAEDGGFVSYDDYAKLKGKCEYQAGRIKALEASVSILDNCLREVKDDS